MTYPQENFRKELNPKNFKKRICVPILKETQPIFFFRPIEVFTYLAVAFIGLLSVTVQVK